MLDQIIRLMLAHGAQHAALVRAIHVEAWRVPQVFDLAAIFAAEMRADQPNAERSHVERASY